MSISNNDIWFGIAGLASSGALIYSAWQLYRQNVHERSWAMRGYVVVNVLGLAANSYIIGQHFSGLNASNAGVNLFICGLVAAMQCGLAYCSHSSKPKGEDLKEHLPINA